MGQARRPTGARVNVFEPVKTKRDFVERMADAGMAFEVTSAKTDWGSKMRNFTHEGKLFWTVMAGERMDWEGAWEEAQRVAT